MTTGTEADREAWVEARLAELTLDEKASLTAGADAWTTIAVPRVSIAALKVTDGPNGARGDATGATAACFPVGTALGATWDVALLEQVGAALAREARTKGSQILLGPTVNIHRTPLGGRNFECYSEDPLLTGRLAAAFVRGLQGGGVGACIKHFVGNESEFERMTISSEIPERALREIYLLPFEHVVATERPWSVMGAYNRVEGTYACAHPRLLRSILKGEWGFDGLVISDWGAVHDTVGSAASGCDLEMPGPARHLGAAVARAVEAGSVPEAAVDDSVRRLLRTLWRAGLAQEPASFAESSVDRPEDRALIRRVGAASMVLLQNDPGPDGRTLLPLGPDRRIALVGPNAELATIMGGGSSQVKAHHQVHPLAALRDRIGADRVTHAPGGDIRRHLPDPDPAWIVAVDDAGRGFDLVLVDTDDISAEPDEIPADAVFGRRVVRQVSWVWWIPPADEPPSRRWGARWTATLVVDETGTWSLGVAAVGRSRVLLDGEVVCDNWTDPQPGDLHFGNGSEEVRGSAHLEAGRAYRLSIECQYEGAGKERAAIAFGMAPPAPPDPIGDAARVAAAADVAVVVVGTDRDWETEGSDRVAMRLPGHQDELIAAVASANPNTVVVLNTGSPVEMPWRAQVPSILQMWFPGQEAGDALVDVLFGEADPGGRLPTTFPVRYHDHPAVHNYPGEAGQVRYGENVFVGYRHYATFGPDPLFAFGHGLSYTSWEMGRPEISGEAPELAVAIPVTNTGPRAGSTVVQLYVRPPRSRLARPDRELKGFATCHLEPGESKRVFVGLGLRSFCSFDPERSVWLAEAGRYDLLVGWSSTDLVHRVGVDLPHDLIEPLGGT